MLCLIQFVFGLNYFLLYFSHLFSNDLRFPEFSTGISSTYSTVISASSPKYGEIKSRIEQQNSIKAKIEKLRAKIDEIIRDAIIKPKKER